MSPCMHGSTALHSRERERERESVCVRERTPLFSAALHTWPPSKSIMNESRFTKEWDMSLIQKIPVFLAQRQCAAENERETGRENTIFGSPAYMAPEHVSNGWVMSLMNEACRERTSHVACERVASLMMLITFITINSSLVPLIEGLCARTLCFRSEIILSHVVLNEACVSWMSRVAHELATSLRNKSLTNVSRREWINRAGNDWGISRMSESCC